MAFGHTVMAWQTDGLNSSDRPDANLTCLHYILHHTLVCISELMPGTYTRILIKYHHHPQPGETSCRGYPRCPL